MYYSDERARLYEEYLLKLAHDKMVKEELTRKKVAIWKMQGSKVVYPDQIDAWNIYVENRTRDLFEGKDIEDALITMCALENGVSIEDAVNCFKETGNSKFYDKIIAQTVCYFSKRGIEFYKQIYKDVFKEKLDEPMLNFISQIEKKNECSEEKLQKQ